MTRLLRAWFAAAAVALPAGASAVDIAVTATMFPNAYYFDGGAAQNPPLTLTRGETYNFILGSSVAVHPFRIQSTNVFFGSLYNAGVTNNDAASGTVTFVVPNDAPDTLYYYCRSHSGMFGTLSIVDGSTPPAPTAHDFDGDGKADILWRNASTGENYLYPMDGTSIGAGEGYLRTVADLSWKIAGVGDFDGDAKADVLWRNLFSGENYIYLMDGTAIQGEGYLRTVADLNWEVAGVGDFNGDGNDDILWRNTSTGENYLYPMDGLAILPAEGYLRTVASHHWQVAGVAKLDAGATADILWRNTRTGENYIYLMDGTAISGEGYIRTVADLNWQVAGVGDHTGEGMADILWRNVATGENYVYPMNGTSILAGEGYVRTVSDLDWRVAGVADYDGDGKADLLWRHAVSGDNYLYPMDGTAIKPGEGYLRAVAELNWKARHSSPFALRRGPVDGEQVPFDTAASGTTWAKMDLFTREMSGIIQTSGLSGTFAAHIHLGARGVDGGVIVNYVAQGDNDWVPAPGERMPLANYVAFLTDGTYVNLHTPARTAGEIRGQLE
jgi:hypothetical protein